MFVNCQRVRGEKERRKARGRYPKQHITVRVYKANIIKNCYNSVCSLLTSSSATVAIFGHNSSRANSSGAEELGPTYTGDGPCETHSWCYKLQAIAVFTESGIKTGS